MLLLGGAAPRSPSAGGSSRWKEPNRVRYGAAWNFGSKTNNALTQSLRTDSRRWLTSISRSGMFTLAGNTTAAASSATVNGSSSGSYGDHTYAKDGFSLARGNNTFTLIAQDSSSRSDTNVMSAKLRSSASLSYDNNGNLASDGPKSFDQDNENRLIRVTVSNSWKTEFVYDGLGHRRVRD